MLIKVITNIKDYYLAEEIGYSELKESKNEYKPYLNIISANDKYLKNMGVQLVDGRLPENDSEILITNLKNPTVIDVRSKDNLITLSDIRSYFKWTIQLILLLF